MIFHFPSTHFSCFLLGKTKIFESRILFSKHCVEKGKMFSGKIERKQIKSKFLITNGFLIDSDEIYGRQSRVFGGRRQRLIGQQTIYDELQSFERFYNFLRGFAVKKFFWDFDGGRQL